MSEKIAYAHWKGRIQRPLDRIERIENVVGIGTPDINYCIEGKEGWIELKQPTEPKKDTTPLFGSNHKLSQGQKNWFLRQFRAKGRGHILIATDKRWILISGALADHVNEMTVSDLVENSQWSTMNPVKEEQWGYLREILTKEK